jgi:enoyl-CoA hydratase/carnithine racemase
VSIVPPTSEIEPPVVLEKRGHTALLRLNRPNRLNALTQEVFDLLKQAWLEIDRDPDVRVTIFTGTGRAFCAGADMVGRTEAVEAGDAQRAKKRPLPKFTARHCKVYKPVIAAVNGVCAGAGLHFIVDSDIVIAADVATFTDSHVNVGQMTALEPIGLSRKIPLGAVLRMVAMGRSERMTSDRAYELGMVTEVVPSDTLMERAGVIADQVALGSPDTLRKSLQMIWESLDMGLEQALEIGWDRIQDHYPHPDSTEGPAAFVEKRAPNWTAQHSPEVGA